MSTTKHQLIQEFLNLESINPELSILYVDDDEIALTVFQTQFQDKYQIHTAMSADEGREILSKNKVSIIISDQFMPDETGSDFFKSISSEYDTTLKILLTSHSSEMGYVTNALQSGKIWRYIIKPVKEIELAQILRNAKEVVQLRTQKRAYYELALRMSKEIESQPIS